MHECRCVEGRCMKRPPRERVSQAVRRHARRSRGAETEPAASPMRRQGAILTRPERALEPRPLAVRSSIWYRAILSADVIAAGGLSALCEQFAVAVREAGEPAGACLFAITDKAGGDCQDAPDAGITTAIFFSPTAISVVPSMIVGCAAHPSTAPERARAALLVGCPSDWDLLPCASH